MLYSITPEQAQFVKPAYHNIQRQLKNTHLHLVMLLVIVDRDPANQPLFIHLSPCLTVLTLPPESCTPTGQTKNCFLRQKCSYKGPERQARAGGAQELH